MLVPFEHTALFKGFYGGISAFSKLKKILYTD